MVMITIQHFDSIPEKIAQQMVQSKERNNLIVRTYKEKQKEYGQTLVFAVNIAHAIQLKTLFEQAGIKADYIVSSLTISRLLINLTKENEKKIQAYRDGKLQVLINVNILTEGVDLPQTQTVFLARPTVSTILMTQMVGRALRGVKAGGTANAYIVSFIDNWNEHIAWVNPESLFEGSNDFFDKDPGKRIKRDMMMISVAKLEEFAKILDDTVDTTKLENVPFLERIPLGMYTFSYTENISGENQDIDYTCEVMVYNSTEKSYQDFINYLPELFKKYNSTDTDTMPDEILFKMEAECHDKFFKYETIPPYAEEDVLNILKYYDQYSVAPQFYSFDYIDKNRLDITQIAQYIINAKLSRIQEKEYITALWNNNDENILKLFFVNKTIFKRHIDIEIDKILEPPEGINISYPKIPLINLPLYEIGKIFPQHEQYLRDTAFEKSKNPEGKFQCAHCGLTGDNRLGFEVDHITPMNKGGKSVPENLQILCRSCNRKKSDK